MVTNAKMAPHVIWLADRFAAVSAESNELYILFARKAPPKWGRDSEVDPCLARVRREQKSRGKRHQIWCPFHPDVTDSPH
jgi:hypothetical protein